MTEVQHNNTNGASDATHAKKRKGFFSTVFGRSSNAAKSDENKNDEQPENKGFMASLMVNAREAVTNEIIHVAQDEATKEIEAQLNNTNGSQPTNTDTTTTGAAPDASTLTTTTPSDVLSGPTNWAKRMVDNAQQKVQSWQQDLTS